MLIIVPILMASLLNTNPVHHFTIIHHIWSLLIYNHNYIIIAPFHLSSHPHSIVSLSIQISTTTIIYDRSISLYNHHHCSISFHLISPSLITYYQWSWLYRSITPLNHHHSIFINPYPNHSINFRLYLFLIHHSYHLSLHPSLHSSVPSIPPFCLFLAPFVSPSNTHHHSIITFHRSIHNNSLHPSNI